jgi:hypothetical protein
MTCTLKVRDRTTNKIREAQIDQQDYERLKGYNYLIDKNSEEPFREVSMDGKRPRIALKRDVMGFPLGDPRRVCYVDKKAVMDCRRSNLKTKTDEVTEKPKVVKIVKPVTEMVKKDAKKEVKKETKKVKETPVVAAETPVVAVETPVVAKDTAVVTSSLVLPTETSVDKGTVTDLEMKRTLMSQLDQDMVLSLLPMDVLLGAWAETHGYKKQA